MKGDIPVSIVYAVDSTASSGMSSGFFANPTRATAQLAIDLLPMLPVPVAGGLGLLFFFAALITVPAIGLRLIGIRL
ncbi:hypothetical protein [Vreelandella massiliensis]|uniref:hypothetical protein n=1 Tax=Vreelandella massiliensis TaxID=1816686 RepID=UPI00096A3780|nr:hypothetical protein [Halomonas massiliensis]